MFIILGLGVVTANVEAPLVFSCYLTIIVIGEGALIKFVFGKSVRSAWQGFETF